MSSAPRMRSASAVDRNSGPGSSKPARGRRSSGRAARSPPIRSSGSRRRPPRRAAAGARRCARRSLRTHARAAPCARAGSSYITAYASPSASRGSASRTSAGIAASQRVERLAPALGEQRAPRVQRETDERGPCLRFDVQRGGGVEVAARDELSRGAVERRLPLVARQPPLAFGRAGTRGTARETGRPARSPMRRRSVNKCRR